MTTFLDKMKAARKGRITTIDRFIRDYGDIKKGVFVFVEGKHDKSYYQAVLRRFLKRGTKVKLYVCGNKKFVIENENKISLRTLPDGVDTFYFVDRDFDEFTKRQMPTSSVYLSEGYSFENLVIDRENAELAWESGVTEAESSITFDIIKRIFLRQYAKFAKVMLNFSAHVICRRKYPISDKEIILQNDKLTKLMTIDNDLNLILDEKFIDRLSEQVGLVKMAKGRLCFNKIRETLKRKGSKYYIRGKYLIKFIRVFLEKLSEIGKSIDRNFSIDVNITDRNIVDYILSRGNLPTSLVNYINGRLSPINKPQIYKTV